MLARNFRILAIVLVFALLAVGCTNPETTFNDFAARQKALDEGGVTTEGGTDAEAGEVAPCVPPAPGDLDGKYLFALSAGVNPKLPVLFLADLKSVAYTDNAGASAGLDITLQSLDVKDRKTPVGAPLTIPTLGLRTDGQIEPTPLPEIIVNGKANPISVGMDIVAHATLHGRFCGVQDFYCGTLSGNVTKPISIPLDGTRSKPSRIRASCPTRRSSTAPRTRRIPRRSSHHASVWVARQTALSAR